MGTNHPGDGSTQFEYVSHITGPHSGRLGLNDDAKEPGYVYWFVEDFPAGRLSVPARMGEVERDSPSSETSAQRRRQVFSVVQVGTSITGASLES